MSRLCSGVSGSWRKEERAACGGEGVSNVIFLIEQWLYFIKLVEASCFFYYHIYIYFQMTINKSQGSLEVKYFVQPSEDF